MGIQYLWHDHPLEIRSVLSDAGSHCYVCQKHVSGYNYKCAKCNFFLHISCLKLPIESVHPLHQDCPLTLLSEPPHDVDGKKVLCNKCRCPCGGFTYHCATCSFSLHLQCTLGPYTFNFEIHKHPLKFSAWPPSGFESFLCKICGECGSCFCLFCKSCQFVVHVECSPLPATARYTRHEHIFNLISVQSIEDGTGEFYCTICEERVNVKGCIYYCADCEYIGHLGCMVSISEHRSKLAYRDVNISSIDILDEQKHKNILENQHDYQLGQEDEELAKLRWRFSEFPIGNNEQLSDQMSSKSEHQKDKLEHFSHKHSLTLDNDYKEDRVMCYACWGRISRMAYVCNQCKFFLHKWCAELPQKIQHPIHPEHSLILLTSQPSYGYCCNACNEPFDGFTYTCKACYFNLHAICASIPSTLRNEIHQHPLLLCRKCPYSTRCASCKDDCIGTVFECEMCNLVLDFKCALLPYKIKHNCHMDPLTLTSLIEDEEDEYYCFACEERREPNHWVYYCASCEFSAHKTCVVSELAGGPQKEGPVGFNLHEHLLGLITKTSSDRL